MHLLPPPRPLSNWWGETGMQSLVPRGQSGNITALRADERPVRGCLCNLFLPGLCHEPTSPPCWNEQLSVASQAPTWPFCSGPWVGTAPPLQRWLNSLLNGPCLQQQSMAPVLEITTHIMCQKGKAERTQWLLRSRGVLREGPKVTWYFRGSHVHPSSGKAQVESNRKHAD